MVVESFATVVGLISQYRAERGAKAQLEFNDFMEWLAKANHSETKGLLELNTDATIYIKALLNEDHKIFKEKLDKIDAAITSFASSIEGFDKLAIAINPSNTLSPQATSILQQFQQSGASNVLEIKTNGGNFYQFLEVNGGLEITEPRFVEDDLATLVELGLLRHAYNSKGSNMYMFTRSASYLVS